MSTEGEAQGLDREAQGAIKGLIKMLKDANHTPSKANQALKDINETLKVAKQTLEEEERTLKVENNDI
ncbi:hypothetical protein JCM3774_003290 [Rhodotorula dairenensis]